MRKMGEGVNSTDHPSSPKKVGGGTHKSDKNRELPGERFAVVPLTVSRLKVLTVAIIVSQLAVSCRKRRYLT